LNPPEATDGGDEGKRIAMLTGLPSDGNGPVFAEPWQAQAFALAVRLHATGAFSWPEWAAALADELKATDEAGIPDDGTRYYAHWLAALERMVISRGFAGREALADRKEAWADAFRRTPHGQPVEL
jgi:nitrile hydratase accessory protein